MATLLQMYQSKNAHLRDATWNRRLLVLIGKGVSGIPGVGRPGPPVVAMGWCGGAGNGVSTEWGRGHLLVLRSPEDAEALLEAELQAVQPRRVPRQAMHHAHGAQGGVHFSHGQICSW